jgi:hypothetical protein
MAIEVSIKPFCKGFRGNRHSETELKLIRRGRKEGSERATFRCEECEATTTCNLDNLKNEILVAAIEAFPKFTVRIDV